MSGTRPTKGETTRQHVLDTALQLFRRGGFERTTMREIAEAAGLSLGAAYHYFPAKETLVQAWYGWMQTEHERLAADASPPSATLDARIRALFGTKLDLLRRDRKLLAALFGNLGDASHPLSVFGKETASVRDRSIAQFVAVFDDASVPAPLREPLGRALWLAHLGVVLVFIHDTSRNQARTRKLVDTLVDLVVSGLPLFAHPLAAPMRERFLEMVAAIAPLPDADTKS
jgi:AcrR family transcriptional regulator